MGLMGFLSKGSRVTITFEADATNTHSTGLAAGFFPNTIDPILEFAPPGQIAKIEIDPLPPSEEFRIEVDTPEAVGKGFLTVTQNDVVLNSETLLDDTEWFYFIQ